jgi:hypothetical protein
MSAINFSAKVRAVIDTRLFLQENMAARHCLCARSHSWRHVASVSHTRILERIVID